MNNFVKKKNSAASVSCHQLVNLIESLNVKSFINSCSAFSSYYFSFHKVITSYKIWSHHPLLWQKDFKVSPRLLHEFSPILYKTWLSATPLFKAWQVQMVLSISDGDKENINRGWWIVSLNPPNFLLIILSQKHMT